MVVNNLLDLVQEDVPLHRVSDTAGGEYAGPCPWCGGRDRFRVWPHREKPRWWCRGCGRRGDAVGYVMQRHSVGYPEALRRLGIAPGRETDRNGRSGGTEGIYPRRSACETVKPRETGGNGVKPAVNPAPNRDAPAGAPGLSLAALAEAKRLPVRFLRGLGLHDARYRGRPAVAIPYLDEAGSEVVRRFRLALSGDQRFAWQKGARVLPYGLQRLAEARRAGWVLIVEGESDCWTAWHHGLPALGLPGKSVWRSEWATYVAGLEVVIWQEPGAEDFALRLGRDLPEARVIVAPEGVKDLSAAHLQGHDVRALVERLTGTARPVLELLRAAQDAELQRLQAQAAPVLDTDDPLERVQAAIRGLGYGGDLAPAVITYLCLTTRLLAMRPGAMPAHLLLVGPPSAGKSYTLQSVLRLHPNEAYHTIDAGSPRVLIYDDADLRHRAVIFSEADSLPAGEDNPAASAVRNLLQDHRLHYAVTVRDPETGQFTVKEVEKPGPSLLVTTAVRAQGSQLGTRLFVLAVPEDVQRIQDALAAQADLELSGAVEVDQALIAYQAYLQRLAPWDVVVPFARALAEAIGGSANATRILRDFQRLLALIKAVAVLRHRRRVRQADGRLVATIEDYATVHALVGPMYESTLTGATETVRGVVEAVRALRADGVEPVTYTAVARRVGMHPEQVKRLARIAIKHDWLTNRAEGKHKPADLDVSEPLPERTGLPTPEDIAATFFTALHTLHPLSHDFTVSQANRGVEEGAKEDEDDLPFDALDAPSTPCTPLHTLHPLSHDFTVSQGDRREYYPLSGDLAVRVLALAEACGFPRYVAGGVRVVHGPEGWRAFCTTATEDALWAALAALFRALPADDVAVASEAYPPGRGGVPAASVSVGGTGDDDDDPDDLPF